jgi:hypothetical protein
MYTLLSSKGHQKSTLFFALLSLSALSACVEAGKDDSGGDSGQLVGDGGGGDGGGPVIDPLLNECTPVSPTSQSGVLEGTLARPEALSAEFVAPADRLKGVLSLQLESPRDNADPVTLGVSIDHPDMGIDDTELDKAPEEGVAVMAAVSPGEVVTMRLAEWGAELDAPESYAARATWAWIETDDCFEPNDQIDAAKHVPTNEAHSAWMLQGLGADDDLVDWYRFTLAEDSVVTLNITHPETVPMGWSLFAGDRDDSGGELAGELFAEPAGSVRWTSDGALPAGTYTLRLQPFTSLAEVDYPLRPSQPHLSVGYSFQVDAAAGR